MGHRQRALTEAMAETGEVDIYRDTPLRYLGYANEVGEAFRALMHVRWVRATYGVASAYVLADTYDKGVKQSKEPGADTSKVAIAAVDTLLWQALASVIVPEPRPGQGSGSQEDHSFWYGLCAKDLKGAGL